MRDRAAALGLSAVHDRLVALEETDLAPLVEAKRDLREQRPGRHRADHPVRQLEAQLLGDLEAERLRALRVVGPHVHVHERPVTITGQLRAEAVDVVVAAPHRHELGPVDAGGEHLLLLQVGRDEDVGLEPRRRRVGSHCVGEVSGRRAGHDLVAELAGLRQRDRHHAILE